MPRGSTPKITERTALIERLAAGATLDQVGSEYGCSRRTIAVYWAAGASDEQRARRRRTAKRVAWRACVAPFYPDLVARACSGERWAAIGADLFPQKIPSAALTAAQTMFHQNATAAQRDARRLMLCVRDMGPVTEADRRFASEFGRAAAARPAAVPSGKAPFAGMGNCFA